MTDATDDRTGPTAGVQPQQPDPQPQGNAQQPQQYGGQPDAQQPYFPQQEPQLPVAPPFTEPERVARGLALALLVIPAGIIVWTVLWSIGFIASIVSWGVAAGAVWLYRRGSKARVTRGAFWGIIAIVLVTVVLSFLAGIFSDVVAAVGIPFGEAITSSKFWQVYADNIFSNGDMWRAYLPQVLLAALFAALGCFMTLRRLSRESRR